MRECVNYFVVLDERRLRSPLAEDVARHNLERLHQAVGNVPLTGVSPPEEEVIPLSEVRCWERLGGLLRRYTRRSAVRSL
jgi:hypothetical protein